MFRIGNTSRMASLLFMPLCYCIGSCLVFQWVIFKEISKSHFYIMLPSQNDWTFSACNLFRADLICRKRPENLRLYLPAQRQDADFRAFLIDT